jgi:hypothetical protein
LAIADSGYGSEENYEFMENNNIEPFVKFNYFYKEQKLRKIKKPSQKFVLRRPPDIQALANF